MDNDKLKEQIQDNVSDLLGEYGWLIFAGFIVLFFKSSLESLLAGLTIFLGSDLNPDDIVILDGHIGRVIRCGIWKSTFYLYNIIEIDGKPTISGGTKVIWENVKLKDLKIEKPLQTFDLENYIKPQGSRK